MNCRMMFLSAFPATTGTLTILYSVIFKAIKAKVKLNDSSFALFAG